jgi:hypothetical protein
VGDSDTRDDRSYRTDCSGFVSMTWGLPSSYTTDTLPQVTHPINEADLLPGDALLRSGDHVALFLSWANNARTSAVVREESEPGKPALQTTWSAAAIAQFTPVRYNGIIDDNVTEHRMVIGKSADGRLEAFASGSDQVYHTYQTPVNGPWATWAGVGGPAGSHLAIAPDTQGRLELFAINDGVLQHIYQTAPSSTWSNWETTFGGGGSDVAVNSDQDGGLEVFASNSGTINQKCETSSSTWSAWVPIADGGPGVF